MRLCKKLLTGALILAATVSLNTFAKNNLSEIDISVNVFEDGSARIVQNWQGEFDEGTENYIPISTDDIAVSDLKVSDEKGLYALIDNWDVDAGFDEKSRKCGINETSDGVELCFGISDYGKKEYCIEYTVTDFIKSYRDFDGTNFMFVNPGMNTFPTLGYITIKMENGMGLNEHNAGIWGFGFDGEVGFQDDAAQAWTGTELSGDDFMIVMLQLNKGIIFPSTSVDKTFEDVKNNAFEGSDYGYDYGYTEDDEDIGFFDYVIGFLVLLVLPLLLILFLVFLIKRKCELRKFFKGVGYFRDIPNGGRLEISHFLVQNYDVANEDSLIIGALMLSMINKGLIEPLPEESTGLFGKVKQSVNLKLLTEPDNKAELSLYHILKAASGEDGILQEKELEKYSYRHPEAINSIIKNTRTDGEDTFALEGGFLDGSGNRIKDLTDKGKEALSEVAGLKKYLEDFSLIAEREIGEVTIWKDYMVYATLFGIAEKVLKQLENVYPDHIPEFNSYGRNVIIANSYYRSMYHSSQRAIQQQRTGGAGGRASIGGGGGFSGGGRGGGSR